MDAIQTSTSGGPVAQDVDEIYLVQNPALGAVLLWKFVEGYKRASDGGLPMLPLAFIVLPIIFNEALRDAIGKTFESSGMRLFVSKFSKNQESLFSIQRRMITLRSTTLASLSIAIEAGLLRLNHSTAIIDCSAKPLPPNVPASIKVLAKQAEKLGAWCSVLTIQEIQSILRIGF